MLDGRYRFESFVSGPSNRLAVAAANAVADSPGKIYQPLFLYGHAGLGKTHLLGAIGFQILQNDNRLIVHYRPAGEFAEQLRGALTKGDLNAWRREWETMRVLLLDDVQLLGGQPEAQGELLRLIDQAQASGGQVVLSSDHPPADLDGFDHQLVSRMSSGLVVDIAAPEFETRLGILWLWRGVRMLELDDAALDEIARFEVDSVSTLLRLFDQIVAQRSLEPEAPASGVAREVVSQARDERSSAADEFESFLNEMSAVVTSSVEQWRDRLASAVARWAGEGYDTSSLERFLDGKEPPDLDAVERQFAAAVNQLRDLEHEAARLDPKLAGVSVFRDPSRIDEARGIVMRALAAYDPPPAPAEHLTIGTFAAGARNQLALRAAGEVIALPGTRFNPLFIHGPQSSGKSHLAHAVANALRERDGGAWIVAVVDAGAMGEELIDAMRTGALDRWRMRYRAADALVVDNVHRIGGSDRLQDEFFQLFLAFTDAGRQVILTADGPPSRLAAIASRLQSRFESGLVVEIGPVSEEEAVARHTPVPEGDEAAAPTIDAWFEDVVVDTEPARSTFMDSSGLDSFFLDPEKVVMEWPGLDGRVVEDPR
jgi:chromosomal replication initiation ATPase DnaA